MGLYKETKGYIIHSRAYKDSSLLLELFSCNYGMMHFIAKGIKKNKKFKSQLGYFNLVKIQYYGKSNLKTISSINILESINLSSLVDKTVALYLNELLHYSLAENEKAESLYHCYQHSIKNIGKQKLTPLLRKFEEEILKYNGFELSYSHFDNVDDWLFVSKQDGLIVAKGHQDKICQVADLKQYMLGGQLSKDGRKRINKLMQGLIDLSLSYRKIYSRDLLKSLFHSK